MKKPHKPKNPAEPTITNAELAEITGWTDNFARKLATLGYFPHSARGHWKTLPTLAGIIKYLREQVAKKDDRVANEKLALAKVKRETAEENLANARGRYVLKDEIGPALRNISLHQRAVFIRKFEQELAPNCANLTTLEIIPKFRKAIDETCAVFFEGVKPWLDAPPNGENGESHE